MSENAKSARVWKILRPQEWAEAGETIPVSRDDARDGYVHLSSATQVAGTLARYFTDTDAIVLLGFESSALGPALRWEASTGGALYPHLYGQLRVADAVAVWRLERGSDGAFALPAEFA